MNMNLMCLMSLKFDPNLMLFSPWASFKKPFKIMTVAFHHKIQIIIIIIIISHNTRIF